MDNEKLYDKINKLAQQNPTTGKNIMQDSWNNIQSALTYKDTKPGATIQSIRQHLDVIEKIIANNPGLAAKAESYSDTAKGTIITRKRALHEIAKHHIMSPEIIAEFDKDMGGQKEHYDALEVLHWLGY